MPRLRATTLQDPIEFEIPGGKTFTVREITPETIERIAEIGARADGANLDQILTEQLCEFTGADQQEFAGLTTRQRIMVRDFIMQSYLDPLGRSRAGARPQ